MLLASQNIYYCPIIPVYINIILLCRVNTAPIITHDYSLSQFEEVSANISLYTVKFYRKKINISKPSSMCVAKAVREIY